MPFSVPPIPKPATASRRGAPPHRPGRGRQAPPRWYSFTPPQWHVFSPPLTAGSGRLHAQAARHPQRHAQAALILEGHHSGNRRYFLLTSNTVAEQLRFFMLDVFVLQILPYFAAFAIDSIKSEIIPHYIFLAFGWLMGRHQALVWAMIRHLVSLPARLNWRVTLMLVGASNLVAVLVVLCIYQWVGRNIDPLVWWFIASGPLMVLCDATQRDSLLRRTVRLCR